MKNKILILAAILPSLAGCVDKVYVPYAVCPKPAPFAPSDLLSDQIRPTDPVDMILKAYVADLVTLKGDRAACLKQLEPYYSIPEKLPPELPAK